MVRGIVAGFGEPLAHEMLALASRGIAAIRQGLMKAPAGDLRPGQLDTYTLADVAAIRTILAEFEAAPCWPLWIVTPETLGFVPNGAQVELLNEPNLHGWTPDAYARVLNRALNEALARGITIWAGGIANLSAKDLDWLARVLQLAPRTTHVAVHRYADPGHDFDKPKRGFKSRTEEMWRLGDVLAGRPYLVSEFGAHMAPERLGWWLWKRTVQLTEAGQAAYLRREFAFWGEWGAHAAFVYQLNDDPKLVGKPLGHYGIRTVDGRWKASAEVFA